MKRFLFTVTVIFLAGGIATVWSNDDQSKIFPYKYEMKDLPNGLRVIVVPTGYPNIVSLQIPVQTGSRNEVEPGKSGFAHFFEHMMFRGTEKYSAEAYNEILKNAGADQNAFTTDDFTNYHITFSKEDLETILMLEADRFQNLKYSVEDFKTEARAVLGEYNKNAANPIRKLLEVQRDETFSKHTYKHTTMGFIEDIENMPNQFDYSLEFFNRYYRPEKTIVIVAGDVKPDSVFAMVEKYWGDWKRGSYKADIPVEPAQDGPIYEHVTWESETLPYVTVAFRGPAVSETEIDMATMDVISRVSFSSSSPLYQKLVVEEQKIDQLFAFFPDRIDPYLLTLFARVKDPKDAWYVRDEIQKEFARLRTELVAEKRLGDIKANMKYGFANGMVDSESIASTLAAYVALTRDPETINRVYRLYEKVTPATLRQVAQKYFKDEGMVVVTLGHEPLPETDNPIGSVDDFAAAAVKEPVALEKVLLRNQSPVINFRVLFNVGAASDPAGKEGLANLTAAMITGAGSEAMTYREIQEAMFPLAADFNGQVDKEMTVFTGTTHVDNLDAFWQIAGGQLLSPGWREEDFTRVKSNIVNQIKVGLRANNDEELGKEVLYEALYKDHPYGHLNLGHISALEAMTLDDVKGFYKKHYSRATLVLGLAGNFSDAFLDRLTSDLGALPAGDQSGRISLPEPRDPKGIQVRMVKKDTRATGIHFGFPIDINRAHPDFPALWLVRSYFGEHRSTNSHLFQRIREIRGMNYGDYAYIEYFPNGMFQFHPDPNLARQQQIFQIWIRPVVPEQGHFAVRIAKYELDKLIEDGLSEEDFEGTRNYLIKFVNLLTKSQDRQLGYALDSRYYGIPDFPSFIREGLEKLTLEDVNRVLRKYLQNENLVITIIAKDAEGLRDKLLSGEASPISYDAQKPDELLQEDKIVESYPLAISAENLTIVELEKVFD